MSTQGLSSFSNVENVGTLVIIVVADSTRKKINGMIAGCINQRKPTRFCHSSFNSE